MDICIDTRTLKPGQVFIPIKGPNHDGHDFIPEAIKKGARILDVELVPYAKKYRKKLNAHVIGITGSAGKTTVKDLLFAALSPHFKVVKTLQNENNEIGTPLTLLRADFDTQIILVEMGMRKKGDLAHLAKIVRPTHVVHTGAGWTHIEFFKTQRGLAKAKSEIFIAPADWEKNRYAFINRQSAYYDILEQRARKAGYKLLPYGGQEKIDQNLNLVYQVAEHFGLNKEQIQQGLKHFQSSDHRLKTIRLNQLTLIDDTYNANPDGMLYALQYLKKIKGRKILVVGDMLELGKHSEAQHKKIAQWALDAEVSLIMTIGTQTKAIKSKKIDIEQFDTKAQLHRRLLSEIKAGDVILFKGSRGMKLEESVNYVTTHYRT